MSAVSMGGKFGSFRHLAGTLLASLPVALRDCVEVVAVAVDPVDLVQQQADLALDNLIQTGVLNGSCP